MTSAHSHAPSATAKRIAIEKTIGDIENNIARNTVAIRTAVTILSLSIGWRQTNTEIRKLASSKEYKCTRQTAWLRHQ
jgi:hypothetical protein